MSMISAQIDELRELAGDGSMEWVTGPIRASVLRDAADTIWELRDDLQRANAENAKLRELLLGLLSSHDKMCTQRGNCFGCQFFDTGRFSDVCRYLKLSQAARELGIEVGA